MDNTKMWRLRYEGRKCKTKTPKKVQSRFCLTRKRGVRQQAFSVLIKNPLNTVNKVLCSLLSTKYFINSTRALFSVYVRKEVEGRSQIQTRQKVNKLYRSLTSTVWSPDHYQSITFHYLQIFVICKSCCKSVNCSVDWADCSGDFEPFLRQLNI